MQTRHFPFFFCTTTTLANQSRYLTSRILPVFSRLSTSSLITLLRSGANLRRFCFIGLKVGSTFNLCDITLGSIPTISSCDHAKQSECSCKKDIILFFMSGGARLLRRPFDQDVQG